MGETPSGVREARESVNEAAKNARNVFLFFLLLLFYFGAIALQTDHMQILKLTPVDMPLVNIKLPLTYFYIFTPIIIVLFHFNQLLGLFLLSGAVGDFRRAIKPLGVAEQERQINLLYPFPFIHMLIANHHSAPLRWCFTAIFTIAVVILPIFSLILAQIMFLPFHGWQTVLHQALVVIDLGLVWFFWWKIKTAVRASTSGKKPKLRALVNRGGAAALTLIALFLSFSEAVYPGLWNETDYSYALLPRFDLPQNLQLNGKVLLAEEPSQAVIAAYLTNGKTQADAWREEAKPLDLSGRDLRGADLSFAQLPGANLGLAQLQGANLKKAQLQGADLKEAQLQGANLRLAQLQGADLWFAQLQGANLKFAQLQGADLLDARLGQLDKQEGESLRQKLEHNIPPGPARSLALAWVADGMKGESLPRPEFYQGANFDLTSPLAGRGVIPLTGGDFKERQADLLREPLCSSPEAAAGFVRRYATSTPTARLLLSPDCGVFAKLPPQARANLLDRAKEYNLPTPAP